jgi:molybdate transport system substrate-binding protein
MPLRLFALLLPLLLSACAPSAREEPVVLAAASLREALEDAADVWSARGHPRPVLSFAGTPALDWLERRDRLKPGTRRIVASNTLVSIVPRGTTPSADEFTNITHGRIALADPESVPAGRYAKAALESMGAWDAVRQGLVVTDNVRLALRLVELGEADGAVVYSSDAAASDKVIVVHRFDPASHPPITYPAAVLAGSDNPEAEDFVAFLATPEAQAALARHGFMPPP